jgi:predicted DNA-binding WGR domain protein
MLTPSSTTALHLTDTGENSNKFYVMMTFAPAKPADKFRLICVYGRMRLNELGEVITKILAEEKVGAIDEYEFATQAMLDKEVAATLKKKTRKGYMLQDLATEAEVAAVKTNAIVPLIDAKIKNMIDILAAEAKASINTYMSTASVAALSKRQIDLARGIVNRAAAAGWFARYTAIVNGEVVANTNAMSPTDKADLQATVNTYYSTIPTRLPNKIDAVKIVEEWLVLGASGETENRLQQLEAQLSNITVSASTPVQNYGGLETRFKHVKPGDPAYEDIKASIYKTLRGQKIRDIFLVTIPDERERYNANTIGKGNVQNMFHCTHVKNAYHILKMGYMIPKGKTNGWRFGPGVYNAVDASRAYGYTGRNGNNAPNIMFVNEVAAGREWTSSGSDESMRAPKPGYDCTRGTGAWSGKGDEWIIYNLGQITIRAIVLLD